MEVIKLVANSGEVFLQMEIAWGQDMTILAMKKLHCTEKFTIPISYQPDREDTSLPNLKSYCLPGSEL